TPAAGLARLVDDGGGGVHSDFGLDPGQSRGLGLAIHPGALCYGWRGCGSLCGGGNAPSWTPRGNWGIWFCVVCGGHVRNVSDHHGVSRYRPDVRGPHAAVAGFRALAGGLGTDAPEPDLWGRGTSSWTPV